MVSSASIRGGRGGCGQFRNVSGQSSLSHPVGFDISGVELDGHGLSEGISVAEGK